MVLDALAKSAVLVVLCLLGLGLLRRSSASTRHAVLLATLAGVVALPLLSAVLPQWTVPYWEHRVAAPPVYTGTVPGLAPAGAPDPAPSVPWWVLAWAAGTFVVGLRIGAGLIAIRLVRHASAPLPEGPLRDRVTDFLDGRRVQVLLGPAERPPMTWGWLRPVLLLPAECGSWPEAQLRSVVLHEVAHIDRGDWPTQLAGRLVCAVYWFHPGVWLIAHRMEHESERAADDRVLTSGCMPEEYAGHLLNVVRSVRSGRGAMSVAMGRRSTIAGRLEAVLASRIVRSRLSRPGVLALVTIVAALLVAVAAAGPRLVRSEPAQVPPPKPASDGPSIQVTARPVPDVQVDDSGATSQDTGDDQSTSDVQADDQSSQDDSGNSDNSSCDAGSSQDTQSQTDSVASEASTDSHTTRATTATKAALADATAASKEALATAGKKIEEAAKRIEGKLDSVHVDGFVGDTPEVNVSIPAIRVDSHNVHVDVPAINIHVPGVHIRVPTININVPKPPATDSGDPSCSG